MTHRIGRITSQIAIHAIEATIGPTIYKFAAAGPSHPKTYADACTHNPIAIAINRSHIVIALVDSLIAGGMGITGVAAEAATIARVLFGIFLLIAIVLFVLVVLGIGAVA